MEVTSAPRSTASPPLDSRSALEALFNLPPIHEVDGLRAVQWLKRGFDDIRANPLPSLFYGMCFALMGVLLLALFRFAVEYVSTFSMGFMLVGPVLAIGLYDLSKQRETGESRLANSLFAWRRNPGGIGIYVLILTVVFLVWARASLVTFALFEARALPTLSAFIAELLALKNLVFVAAFFGIGMLFALLVFVISVVAIPFLYDRKSDAVTAAAVSVAAIQRNPKAMLVWAALIVGLVGLGIATLLIGLVLTGPLIGHATWHAYRDLVADATDSHVLE